MPQTGFWGRMMGQVPGMVNSLAQNYGGPGFQEAARGTSAMLKPGGMKKRLFGGGKKSEAPAPTTGGGIETGPSPMFRMPAIRFGGGIGGPLSPSGNTGITGGMFPGRIPPIDFGAMPIEANSNMLQPGMGGGGLWNTYGRMRRPILTAGQ